MSLFKHAPHVVPPADALGQDVHDVIEVHRGGDGTLTDGEGHSPDDVWLLTAVSTVLAIQQTARAYGVRVAARAHHRVSVPDDGRPSADAWARTTWRLVRGVEYTLTGGSSDGRARVAAVLAAASPRAVTVHVAPFTFVRIPS